MKHIALAVAVLALPATSLSAATVHITPTVTGVLNEDFSPVDASVIIGQGFLAPKSGGYYLLQVDVDVRIDNLGPTEVGFANTAFNSAVFGDGTSLYSDTALGVNAWGPDNPQFDSNGPAPGGTVNKWDINSDDGVPNDLQGVILAGITKGFGPAEYDIRRTLAQGNGDHAGTLYLKLAGDGSCGGVEIIAAFGASTYDATGTATTAGNVAVGGMTERWGTMCIPEPSSWALLAITTAGLAVWRRERGATIHA